MTIAQIPDETLQALDVARTLVAAGVPIFLAAPDPSSSTGYRLPNGWQRTRPDPAVIDAWRPGMALCAVMGHGLDLLDVDPRSGGDAVALEGYTPTAYAAAFTPSGGVHSFIASLGVRSRDGVLPGVDVKAGDAEGKGRGFAFIAPTVRVSKVTGQPAAYRWALLPDLGRLAARATDDSGVRLRALIDQVRGPQAVGGGTGQPFETLPAETQELVRRWVVAAVEGIRAELAAAASWAPGQRDDHGRGWEKLCADAAYRLGRLARAQWNDYAIADAEAVYFEAAPVDGTWGADDVALKWRQQSVRGEPLDWPGLTSAAERDAEAWARLGVELPAASAASEDSALLAPGQPMSAEAVAGRYFGPGGIQATTAAGDVLWYGPLRVGRDDIMWSYAGGVWSPARHVVRDRLTWLLGQRFRTAFVPTVEATIRARVESISCDPVEAYVNFANGLLDWRSGELRPHDPDVATTVQLPIAYNPEAACPAFEEFVHQVVPEDVVDTVWELIGYLMYSGNPLHKAIMLTGSGRNGKGTFLRLVEALLGSRNITNVSLHDLVNTRFSTASLFGKLANIAGDIDATYLENTATFKGITGGDTISAEHKGRDRFDFKPWAVPMFSANKIPASADTSVGYLSRWLVVPFPNDFTGREDRRLDEKLRHGEELQGIAARGIAALPGLLARGDFALTASGEAAREEFIRRVDQVRTWLSDCCEIAPEHPWVARTELYEAYKTWAFRDGHKAVRASEFYDRIEQAGAEPAIVHGTRGFKRIKVIDNGTVPFQATALWPAPSTPAAPAAPAATDTTAATKPVSAPSMHPTVFAGQPQSFCEEGAEGADTPHPPNARARVYAQVGGLQEPAPSAPTPEPARKRPTADPARTEAAREKRAAVAEEKRQAAIAAAAGPTIELPALVLRDGTVRHVELADAAALLATLDELTVDVEHTGYPIGHPAYALRSVQLGDERFAIDLDPTDPDQAAAIRHLVAGAAILHAHSATADLVPLEVAGLLERGYEEAWSRMHDTVIPAKLADPASTGSDPSLKRLSAVVLGRQAVSPAADEARAALFKAGRWLTEIEATTEPERSGWAQVDPRSETMIRYAASDVLDDAAIARALPAPAPGILEREHRTQRMIARVALHGLRLDGERVAQLRGEQQTAIADAAQRLAAFGVENAGSDQQVAAAVERLGLALPRTRTGRPSVAKGVLEPHKAIEGPLGDLIRARLDYQKAENRLGLFLDGYHLAVTQGDGRVRPTVYTMEAKTGRMSCVRPNLQQVPREGGFRSCITADPGEVLISADFSSVELRVAAALSQDQALAAIIMDPERDIHGEIARLVWGPSAGKPERYQAKRKVFGRLYGSGINGLVTADPPVSEAIARAIVDAMDRMTPGLTAWSRSVAAGVEAGRTQFVTHSGRVVHMPRDRAYAAPNYCVQGTARELLIDGLMRWEQTRWGKAVLWPVHDELVVRVPEDDAEEATAALVECMTTELLGIPIIAAPSAPSFAWRDSE